MKKLAIYTLMGLLILAGACEYQNEETLFGAPDECTSPAVFTTHIEPLIQTNCALSGCHATGGVLPALSSYEQVKARAADIRHQTQSLQMPPAGSGKSLTQAEIRLISCWVEQGALKE